MADRSDRSDTSIYIFRSAGDRKNVNGWGLTLRTGEEWLPGGVVGNRWRDLDGNGVFSVFGECDLNDDGQFDRTLEKDIELTCEGEVVDGFDINFDGDRSNWFVSEIEPENFDHDMDVLPDWEEMQNLANWENPILPWPVDLTEESYTQDVENAFYEGVDRNALRPFEWSAWNKGPNRKGENYDTPR